MEKICVAVRVRPPTSQEISNGSHWKVEENRISLQKSLGGTPISGTSYAFDHVFDQDSTNQSVYQLLTKDIIRAAVDGFNGTAFAYGQTSSGKTYTMNGSKNDPGIVPLAVKDIFQNILMMTDREFLIRVSYMEIYNEEINDLLTPDEQKLQIHESLDRGIFVAGLREEIVNSAEQVLKLIEAGEVNRHFGETNMNARSSRSHTIFRMVIESKGKDRTSSGDYPSSDAIRVSVLNLVDLAGSERIVKTGAGGVRLKEGKHINKSLLVLGNVINKLSDGGKQRGHIPYRDSKLTRILQPALGGNAKTSIICTVAPEEVHVEETKGTLQFASRAKRITNCAQVNEILTDAALLKRQKQEIEELREKLQGSRSEVLEQEILNLRNDMLKYELEREKLAMELEEERKSHKLAIDNLSSLVSSSDHDKNSGQTCAEHSFGQHHSLDSWDQGHICTRNVFKEENADKENTPHGDSFHTPCFKSNPNVFVARRSNYSRAPEFSPVPDGFSSVADEDTWLKLNKGYTVDLDSLQIASARRTHSLPSIDASPGYSIDYYKEEVQSLKRELELARGEKSELERDHAKQLLLNNQLMEAVSELQKESLLIRDIPQVLCESVASCKTIYKDILSVTQSFVADEKSSTAKLVSGVGEIGISLLTTLEAHFSMASSGHKVLTMENTSVQEQCKTLLENLNKTVSTIVSPEAGVGEDKSSTNQGCTSKYKGSCSGGANTSWKDEFTNEVNAIKQRYQVLKKELDINNQLLEASKERCNSLEKECNTLRDERASLAHKLDIDNQILEASKESVNSLERECNILRDERTSLAQKLSISSQKLVLVTDQRDKLSNHLNTEVQRKKDLEEEVKQFSLAYAMRQRSFMSFTKEFKSKIENLRSVSPIQYPSLMGIEE